MTYGTYGSRANGKGEIREKDTRFLHSFAPAICYETRELRLRASCGGSSWLLSSPEAEEILQGPKKGA